MNVDFICDQDFRVTQPHSALNMSNIGRLRRLEENIVVNLPRESMKRIYRYGMHLQHFETRQFGL